jgi:hypothetical protein
MSDFEVHEIGTASELKLCRDLILEMVQVRTQFGDIFPSGVSTKLDIIVKFYQAIQENEKYKNGI